MTSKSFPLENKHRNCETSLGLPPGSGFTRSSTIHQAQLGSFGEIADLVAAPDRAATSAEGELGLFGRIAPAAILDAMPAGRM
jgi:hypothetical protein